MVHIRGKEYPMNRKNRGYVYAIRRVQEPMYAYMRTKSALEADIVAMTQAGLFDTAEYTDAMKAVGAVSKLIEAKQQEISKLEEKFLALQ